MGERSAWPPSLRKFCRTLIIAARGRAWRVAQMPDYALLVDVGLQLAARRVELSDHRVDGEVVQEVGLLGEKGEVNVIFGFT